MLLPLHLNLIPLGGSSKALQKRQTIPIVKVLQDDEDVLRIITAFLEFEDKRI